MEGLISTRKQGSSEAPSMGGGGVPFLPRSDVLHHWSYHLFWNRCGQVFLHESKDYLRPCWFFHMWVSRTGQLTIGLRNISSQNMNIAKKGRTRKVWKTHRNFLFGNYTCWLLSVFPSEKREKSPPIKPPPLEWGQGGSYGGRVGGGGPLGCHFCPLGVRRRLTCGLAMFGCGSSHSLSAEYGSVLLRHGINFLWGRLKSVFVSALCWRD